MTTLKCDSNYEDGIRQEEDEEEKNGKETNDNQLLYLNFILLLFEHDTPIILAATLKSS